MEYREGFTRCPQHDVDLVDEPPEPEEEPPPLLDRIDDVAAIRYTLLAVLGAAALYTITGIALSVVIMFRSTRTWESNVPMYLQYTQTAAWTVALAGLAAIGGAVLVRTYTRLRDPGAPVEGEFARPGPGDRMMRLLFSLVVVFALVWAVSRVATSWEEAKLQNAPSAGFGSNAFEDPSQTFLALIALQNASWACGASALVVMAGTLMRQAHGRMTRRGAPRSG